MTPSPPAIRATYELEPPGSAEAFALGASLGLAEGPAHARARVVSEDRGRALIEFPAANWGPDPALLVSAVVAGEGVETRSFSRCRLVALELPPGLLPGPAAGAGPGRGVGVIVKPSVGLGPAQVAEVASAAAAGGAVLVKDDEIHASPPWCPLEERVEAVASVLDGSTTYFANVTGPPTGLVERARRVVELGAGGVMVNAFAQGLGSLMELRSAGLGVPVLAHRAGSGPWTRNPDFGVSGAVVAGLTRWCGADLVLVGAYGGKMFDTDDDVDAQVAAARDAACGLRPATALLGGGVTPDAVRYQADRAGGEGLVVLLGSGAYGSADGLAGAVGRAVAALGA